MNHELVRELLGKYEFEFVNAVPSQKGKLEALTEEDIEAIIGDMELGQFSPRIIITKDSIVVEYPNGICRLESRGLRADKLV